MKKIIFTLIILFLFAGSVAFAANTVNRQGGIVEISAIDSDWSWSDTFPQYSSIKLVSIQFNPGAADDQCIIKELSDTGPAMIDVIAEDVYDQRLKPIGIRARPVLDYSAGTYSSGSTVIFVFDLN